LGKWWFLFARQQTPQEKYWARLLHLRRMGFTIPDLLDTTKAIQLVAEPRDRAYGSHSILVCGNPACGHIVDLHSDAFQSNAVRKYHRAFFAAHP
jgi:hypothetical protein